MMMIMSEHPLKARRGCGLATWEGALHARADDGSYFVTRAVIHVTHQSADPVPDHGMSRSRLLTNRAELTIAFYSLQS